MASGNSQRKITKLTGVSHSTVSRILTKSLTTATLYVGVGHITVISALVLEIGEVLLKVTKSDIWK